MNPGLLNPKNLSPQATNRPKIIHCLVLTVEKAAPTRSSGQVRQPLVKICCKHPALGMTQKWSMLLSVYLRVGTEARLPEGTQYYQPFLHVVSSTSTSHIYCSRSATSVWPSSCPCLLDLHANVHLTHSCHPSHPCVLVVEPCRSKVHGVQGHTLSSLPSVPSTLVSLATRGRGWVFCS